MKSPSSESEQELYRIRHSLAHVMAQAVLELRPGSKLGFGPPIENGFYYDFILSDPLREEDFPKIEKLMKRIIKQDQKFKKETLPKEKAIERLKEMGEPYKAEYASELFEKKGLKDLTFYANGPFLDMCEGPHCESTKKLPLGAFKLKRIAGAYWRGDEKNVMMTRIYADAFLTKEDLEKHLRMEKEALARDHKKLGKELDLFIIDEVVGRGLPLWLPKGTVIRDELEKLMVELEFKAGFQRVHTPHLTKVDLYYQTGHLPYYQEGMYPLMELKENREGENGPQTIKESYALKPMNCPHHHRVFAARKRSYRELPLRLAEYGTVYRFEDSGAVSGLLRVRGMTMNDAHIYCTPEQFHEEFLSVMNMHKEVYGILGLKDFYMRFSTWDPEDPKGKQKYVDDPSGWTQAQALVLKAMKESGLDFVEGKGEAAFYGPKIDFQLRTVTGREESASTNQLDFGVPRRIGLVYTDRDNQEHHPYVIHRAPLGTHERFVAFLIEHYGGAFPTWLAPIQVRVITVGEKFDDYAQGLVKSLKSKMIRAEFDPNPLTLNKKIREAATQKIPNVLIIGEKEQTNQTVTWKRYGVQEQQTLKYLEFEEKILHAIQTRAQTIN